MCNPRRPGQLSVRKWRDRGQIGELYQDIGGLANLAIRMRLHNALDSGPGIEAFSSHREEFLSAVQEALARFNAAAEIIRS